MEKVDQLEKLEKEINEIVALNYDIILQIEEMMNSQTSISAKFYIIVPGLSQNSSDVQPYNFNLKEEIETFEVKEFIQQWRIPGNMLVPEEVDPDRTLYGTEEKLFLPNKCDSYEDLIRYNSQSKIAIKYLTMLRESVSLKFGLKFKDNFVRVQSLLKLLILNIKNKENPVKLEEMEVRVQDLNKHISRLFEFEGVRNENWCTSKLESKILNKEMQRLLFKMLPKGNFKFTQIHDSTKGIAASQFDIAVKGKGPTLIIIKNNLNFIFGAYVHDIWGASGSWIQGSLETFLFTFGNSNNTKPLKLLHNGGVNGIHITSCGIHLSGDLVAFCSHSCTPTIYTKIAPGYDNVSLSTSTLAGANTWTISYAEVFHLQKI
jgi:hypothetical protein